MTGSNLPNGLARASTLVPIASLAFFVSCHDATSPASAPVRQQTASDLSLPPYVDGDSLIADGIGGSFTLSTLGGITGTGPVSPESFPQAIFPIVGAGVSTGIRLPAGTPVRVVTTGTYTYVQTPAAAQWCATTPTSFFCGPEYADGRYYPWGFDFNPIAGGVFVRWGVSGARREPSDSSITAMRAPVDGSGGLEELLVGRFASCCFGFSTGTGAFAAYAGSWVVTVHPDDGSDEAFENPVVWLTGDNTRPTAPAVAAVDLHTSASGAPTAIRWHYVSDSRRTFNGTPFAAAIRATPTPGTAADATGPVTTSLLTRSGQWDGPSPFEAPGARLLATPSGGDGARPAFDTEPAPSAVTSITACENYSHCEISPSVPGTIVAVVTLADGRVLSAANYRPGFTGPPAPSTSLTLISALGPNLGGSFTTRTSENQIALFATVTPPTLAPFVAWRAFDALDDQVNTAVPATILDGATSGFPVPDQVNSRWSTAPRARDLARRSLALSIEARVIGVGGQTVVTPAATVRQDEIDTMREEYIELGVAQGVPRRVSFAPSPIALEDYTLSVVYAPFESKLAQLRAVWNDRWQVNGVYRNPAHNSYHVSAGASSGTVSASWHQFGCAADIQTFPRLPPPGQPPASHADSVAANNFWDRLQGEALLLGFVVEQKLKDPRRPTASYSGVGHVHIELKCREMGER